MQLNVNYNLYTKLKYMATKLNEIITFHIGFKINKTFDIQ